MTDARLWRNARVFTGQRFAESLLVEDGHVTAVGPAAEVRRAAPTGVETTDLDGRLLIPGLVDAHLHLAELTLSREALDVRGARTVPDLVEKVRRWASEHPTGVIVGFGWSDDPLERGASPTREALDEGVADRPLVIYHASGHAAIVNSAALDAAGIDRSTPDPEGGRIARGPEGTPTGGLFEAALRALAAVTATASAVSSEGLGRTLHGLASLGLTTVATMNAGDGEVAALRSLREVGRLYVRVRVYLRLSALARPPPMDLGSPAGRDRLAVTGVKAFTDGAFGLRTAWLSSPYADAPDQSGFPTGDADPALAQALDLAVSSGLAPALHAIGDRAVERALRLLLPAKGAPTAPARIEHAALTPPELFAALEEVRPALVVQPGFVWSDHWLTERLGRERARWAYAFRTLADRGHLLAGSSDAPYDPIDPWRGLRALVGRRDPEGRSANPETSEAVPPVEALTMYTRNGGRALGEPKVGSLEPGSVADLLVLDSRDLGAAIARGSVGVRETWVGGRRTAAEAPALGH